MATWGLIAETTVGGGDRKHVEAYVLAHVEGEREAALAELGRRARNYVPEHPWNPKRRRLFRHGDGFLLVLDGTWQSYSTRFTIAELLEDSAPAPAPAEPPVDPPAEPPAPEDSVQPPPAEPSVERDADGVPVKPAWLGRADLP
ncbi:hypothetical protein IPZ58_33325 [Streptomyces roseoverticillatus]|uniref:hypothetical protein n=1 Tax=Streptomyces roseoverticillatus TaxID=66429 RepID=UPI001F27CDE2|nr:hypothetical protein [Streptomyces roseoverticillatus]MCF3106413.1 hypothetical protein [Streptomyces roseoverticillatus]